VIVAVVTVTMVVMVPPPLQVPAAVPPEVIVPKALPLVSFDMGLSERIGRIGLGRKPGRAREQCGRQNGEQASYPDHRLLPQRCRIVWWW
jgi:hypothetical protein